MTWTPWLWCHVMIASQEWRGITHISTRKQWHPLFVTRDSLLSWSERHHALLFCIISATRFAVWHHTHHESTITRAKRVKWIPCVTSFVVEQWSSTRRIFFESYFADSFSSYCCFIVSYLLYSHLASHREIRDEIDNKSDDGDESCFCLYGPSIGVKIVSSFSSILLMYLFFDLIVCVSLSSYSQSCFFTFSFFTLTFCVVSFVLLMKK